MSTPGPPGAPFDGNDYRKRVLAAVHRRGGPETSDPFELYDVPVETADTVSDADVTSRLADVWAFWQRQRDHPRYGTLVTLLVETHDERSAPLRDRYRRTTLAARILAEREQRDAARFDLLDQAIRRLVQRHRGVPRDKVDGLIEVGALSGLTPDQVRARLRHHRSVDVAGAAPPAAPLPVSSSVSEHRRQQVRDLLDEFGRLQEVPAPPTLLALLGLDPDANDHDIALRAEAWRVRCRELPPSRVRAVADELLVHVQDLLQAGRAVLEGYLDAVVQDVAARLRPRVRAAVLVEDRLVADDHEHLFEEAQVLGLDPARARALLASLAAELGAEIEPFGVPGGAGATLRHDRPARAWEQPLRAARAALREGRLLDARRLAADAARVADATGTTPVRAVVDEVEDAVREAELRWRAAATALGARRFAEAIEHLEQLCRTAVDLPGPAGAGRAADELDRARAEVAAADAQVAAVVAAAATSAETAAALLAVLDRWPAHPGAVAALAAVPLLAPGSVRAVRERGAVVVRWQPSPTAGVTYRVCRVAPDGATRVVARTPATQVEDGGAPPTGPLPAYTVAAVRAGVSSPEALSGPPAPPAPVPVHAPEPPLPAPTGVTAARTSDGSVLVRWAGPSGAEFKVSRQRPDGRWHVVGRTRATSLEDGGAPAADPLPAYSVVASLSHISSAEAFSR